MSASSSQFEAPRRIFSGRALYGGASAEEDGDDEDEDLSMHAPSSSSSAPVRSDALAVIDNGQNARRLQDDEAVEDLAPHRPAGNANDAETRLETARRQDIRNCPLCWEELPYCGGGRNAAGGAADRTAMLQRIQDFRKVIFRFEQLLSGRQNDETIFTGMLELRHHFIETYLEEHGYRHRKWTIRMLREHYDPTLGHRFDPVRELNAELEDLRRIKKWTMKVGGAALPQTPRLTDYGLGELPLPQTPLPPAVFYSSLSLIFLC